MESDSEVQIEDVTEWIQDNEDPHPTLSDDDIVATCSSQLTTELSSGMMEMMISLLVNEEAN